jgi:hypothetical protein
MSDEVQTERLTPAAAPERVIADRYTLRTELGRGGMGVVWRAEDRVIGRAVAVKEMRLGEGVTVEERAEFEQRIMREARTAGRLNDPAVVTVFDVVHDNGSVFIVMELVEAPTLAQLVRRSGPLSPQAVADIGRQVLSALEAAHTAGIVHRDVKPSNIMVGTNGRAKLTDFGIAQAADDPTLTKTGAVIGSPAYLAPERLSGMEASPASDLWSLGAVLYFAIEGQPAFERDTTAATLGAVLNEVPYLTNAQGPLAAAVSGMLTAAPEGRLTAPQIRTLLKAAASDTTRALPQGTVVMPTGGQETVTVGTIGGPLASAVTPPKRSWVKIAGTVTAAVVATAAIAGFASYKWGYSNGGKHQADEDTRPSDAVTVYTLWGDGADFPTLNLGSSTCWAGPALAPGSPTYQEADCSKPHDLEKYYETNLVDANYSHYGSDGNGPVPYNLDELRTAARELCWADRLMSPWATKGAYQYIALVPSQNLWNGKNLLDGMTADRNVYCYMVNTSGQQLPGDVSQ